jgi:prevent-host-death family protein
MSHVSIRDAKNNFSELGRRAEAGETIVVTRNGKPAFDLVPHKPRTGINWEALAAYKKKHGIDRFVEYIPDDFDDPLPEDFLITPLPPGP